MKVKEKIREWIIHFILLDDIKKQLENKLIFQQQEIDKNYRQINENKESIYILQNTVRNVVSVGTDIVPQIDGRSWAVVCIEGNYNVVKFVDLHGADYRRILDFLKQYEGSRMVIDAPNPRIFDMDFKFR